MLSVLFDGSLEFLTRLEGWVYNFVIVDLNNSCSSVMVDVLCENIF